MFNEGDSVLGATLSSSSGHRLRGAFPFGWVQGLSSLAYPSASTFHPASHVATSPVPCWFRVASGRHRPRLYSLYPTTPTFYRLCKAAGVGKVIWYVLP